MRTWFLLATILGTLSTASMARGQGADAALRDRVGQLVERLAGADDATQVQEATRALIDLGPRALPLLPAPETIQDPAQVRRLAEVRAALEEAAESVNLGPALVSIRGEGLRLSEAIRSLQQQSGNVVTDLRESLGQEVTNPALDLDIKDRPFFEALDILCQAAGLVPNFYTGDGSVGLMAADAPDDAEPAPAVEPWIIYSGPFRVQLVQLAVRRDFVTGSVEAGARVEVAWEPRLRPMLLALAAADLEIVDDRGEPVAPAVSMEQATIPLRQENPVAELNLAMQAPDRAATALSRLRARGEVTLPGGQRTFRAPDLTKPTSETLGDVKFSLLSTQVEDFVWKVRVLLEYPAEGPAFESYQQGLFNNRLWLQKADGTRFEHNGGFSNLGTGGGRIAFEYLFVDAPGSPSDWSLVYETPSTLETIPLEFNFEDVPLP